MTYQPKFWKEVLNTLLHIVCGAAICYVMIPKASILVSVNLVLALGVIREVFQHLRGKDQPLWLIYVDVLGWVVGALIWCWARQHWGIDADAL